MYPAKTPIDPRRDHTERIGAGEWLTDSTLREQLTNRVVHNRRGAAIRCGD